MWRCRQFSLLLPEPYHEVFVLAINEYAIPWQDICHRLLARGFSGTHTTALGGALL